MKTRKANKYYDTIIDSVCFLMQAIEKNDMKRLKEAVSDMKANAELGDMCLNVCATVSKYPMTFLALAGYHARTDMITYLLSHAAGSYAQYLCIASNANAQILDHFSKGLYYINLKNTQSQYVLD